MVGATLLSQQYGAKLLQPSLGPALAPQAGSLARVRDGCKCGHIGGRPASVLAGTSFSSAMETPKALWAL
jgi:hypothetical protein